MRSSLLAFIPRDTADAARSVFHMGNLYLQAGNQMDSILKGVDLEPMNYSPGIPAEWTALLALVTIFQFKERLSDWQASEAVRMRVDWKYALHLPMVHPGIKPSMLCNFRQRLHFDAAGEKAFQCFLDRMNGSGFLGSREEIEASPALTSICTINRVERVVDAMNHALEALVFQNQEWLRTIILPHWYSRYLHKNTQMQGAEKEPLEVARATGSDIHYLLKACKGSARAEITSVPEIRHLERVLHEQFEVKSGETGSVEDVHWRQSKCILFDETSASPLGRRINCYEN